MRRTSISLLVAVVCAAAACALFAAPASASYWHNCGNFGSSDHVRSHKVRCHKAKHVIGRFFVKAQAQGPKVTVGGFHCVGTTPGSKFLVRCRDRHRRVRFHGGIGKMAKRKSCGKVRSYYRDHGTRQFIEASSIRGSLRCSRARRVAHKWTGNTARDTHRIGLTAPARHAAGFSCHYHRIGSDIGNEHCRKGAKRVRFAVYDSSPFH